MVVTQRGKGTRSARAWVGAFAAALFLLVAMSAPIDAAAGRTKLSAATVSPRTGTPTTTITVTVVYQNANGSRAETVSVAFGGPASEMTRQADGSWGKGVTFTWSGTVPAGHHPVVISAKAKDGSDASLPAGSVTIEAAVTTSPKPTPKPTVAPKPTPEPTPGAATTPTATPTMTSVFGAALVGGTSPAPMGIASALGGSPTPQPPADPVTAAVLDGPGLGPSPSADGAIIAGPANGPGGGGTTNGSTNGSGGGPTGGGHGGGWGPLASALAIAGLTGPTFTGVGLAPTLVTTTGAVTAAMALGLFGRRRRDDDLPDDVLSAAASRGVAVAELQPGLAAVAELGEVADMEALMPRWRRPSLLQARKADPIRDNTPAPRLTFDQGLVGPIAGRERRTIRYRVVRLLDTPDELRGTEIGYLDKGDEVQLIEKYGAYWLVLTPNGQEGWLHKMTLGDLVDADAGGAAEGPTATMPIAADTWTMGESDIDSDVLEAYLASRRRNA